MSATQITLANGVFITPAATPVSVYTSPTSASPTNGKGTIISTFTASNGSAANITYKAWMVPDGSSVGDEFLLVPERIIKVNKTDVPYETAGHFMPPLSQLYIESDTANAAGFRVSGVELTI